MSKDGNEGLTIELDEESTLNVIVGSNLSPYEGPCQLSTVLNDTIIPSTLSFSPHAFYDHTQSQTNSYDPRRPILV